MKTLAKVTLDFYRDNYVVVNAKQYDHLSRQIDIALTNKGSFFAVNKTTMYATVQTASPSGVSRFETVTVNDDGTVSFVLTNQHLAEYGDLSVEIIIFQASDNTRLAAVGFTVHVLKSNYKGVEQDIIESDQFAALTEALNTALATYNSVIEQAEAARDAALVSEGKALVSEQHAKTSETNAATSEGKALSYEQLSQSYAIGSDNVYRTGDITDNSKYYSQVALSHATTAESAVEAIEKEYEKIISDTGGIVFAIDEDTGEIMFSGDYDLYIDYDGDAASGTGILCYEHL